MPTSRGHRGLVEDIEPLARMRFVVRLIGPSQAPAGSSVIMAWSARLVDKVSSQFRLNRFLPSCLEIKSMRDSLVSGAVVAGLPLVNSGAKLFEDVMSFVPGCPLSA